MDYTITQTLKCEDNTIVISDEDNEAPKSKVARSNERKPKRKVSLEKKEKNVETLIVTQKVKVKKQNIMCVINVNTNVYNNAVEDKIESGNSTRIIPKCSRKKCQYVFNTNKKEPRQRRKHKVLNGTNKKNQTKYHKKHHCPKHKHNIQTNILPDIKLSTEYVQTTMSTKQPSLSPISLSPLKSDEISYDSISLDSFSSDRESKLDTLIKRARERDQQHLICNQSAFTNTAQKVIEISSDDETSLDSKSFKNTSIHSLATLILEPDYDKSAINVNAPNYSPEKILDDADYGYKILPKQYIKETSGVLCDDTKIFKTKMYSSADNINNNVNDNDYQYKESMIFQ